MQLKNGRDKWNKVEREPPPCPMPSRTGARNTRDTRSLQSVGRASLLPEVEQHLGGLLVGVSQPRGFPV